MNITRRIKLGVYFGKKEEFTSLLKKLGIKYLPLDTDDEYGFNYLFSFYSISDKDMNLLKISMPNDRLLEKYKNSKIVIRNIQEEFECLIYR